MPNWKKVVVSGSRANLSHITSSGNLSASGDLIIKDITASGNIRGTGKVRGEVILTKPSGSINHSIHIDGGKIKFFDSSQDDFEHADYRGDREKARLRAVPGSFNLALEISGSRGYTSSVYISQSGKIGFNTDDPQSQFDAVVAGAQFQKPGERKGLRINDEGNIESFNRDANTATTGSEFVLRYSRGTTVNEAMLEAVTGENFASDAAAVEFFNALKPEEQNSILEKAEALGFNALPSVGDVIGSIRFIAESGSTGAGSGFDDRETGEAASITSIVHSVDDTGVRGDLVFKVADQTGAAVQRMVLDSGDVHQLTGSFVIGGPNQGSGAVFLHGSSGNTLGFIGRYGSSTADKKIGRTVLYDDGTPKVQISAKGKSYITATNDGTHTTGARLGIETTDPKVELEVVGEISASSNIYGKNIVSTTHITASGNISASGTGSFTHYEFPGSSGNITGHLIPSADATYDLGSTNSEDWNNLYVRSIDIFNQRFKLGYTGTTATLADHSSVGDGFQFTHLGTEILRLGNDGDYTANFSANITSSGNISASGEVFGNSLKTDQYLYLGADASFYRDGVNIIRTDDVFHANGDIHVFDRVVNRGQTSNYIEFATNKQNFNVSQATFTGDITASGNISASGTIAAIQFIGDGSQLSGISAAGNFVESEGTASLTNITASGNISSSGMGTFAQVRVGESTTTNYGLIVDYPDTRLLQLKRGGSVKVKVIADNNDGQVDIYDNSGNSDIRFLADGDSYITNNLGIGTTAPAEKLTVVGDISASVDIHAQQNLVMGLKTDDPKLTIYNNQNVNNLYTHNSASVNNATFVIQGGNWTHALKLKDSYNPGGVATEDIADYAKINGGYTHESRLTLFTSTSYGGLDAGATTTIGTATSSLPGKLTVTGNVGIGTSDPISKMELQDGTFTVDNGNITVLAGGISVTRNSSGNTGLTVNQQGTADILNLQDNGTEVFTVIDGGNVGIGTTSPVEKLHIVGNISASGALQLGATVPIKLLVNGGAPNDSTEFRNGGGEFKIYSGRTTNANHQSFVFASGDNYTSGATRMIITGSTGNVGIGTTSPTRLLQVVGSSATSGISTGTSTSPNSAELTANGTNYAAYLLGHSFLAFGTNHLNVGTAASEKMRITNEGNVGIGAGSSPGEKLTVSGSLRLFGEAGHITASGNISSSGTTFTQLLELPSGAAGSKGINLGTYTHIYESGGLNFDSGTGTRPIYFRINGTKKLELDTAGNITASGDIVLQGTAPTIRIQDTRQLNNPDWDNVSLGNIEFYSSDTTSPGARVLSEIEAFSNNAAASGPNSDLIFKTSANTDSSPQTRLTIGHDGTATFAGNVTAGSNSLTAGSLDINGNADISGDLDLGGDLKLDLGDNIRFGGQLALMKESNGELKLYGGTNSTDGGFELFTWNGSSYVSAFTLKNNQTAAFVGDVTVAGTLTAQEFHTEFVSASIVYESGSTKFGDTQDDNHAFTGSLNLSGSVNIQGSGNITASGDISASGDVFGLNFGRDADNLFNFSTDNELKIRVHGGDRLLVNGSRLAPTTDSYLKLGSSSLRFQELNVNHISASGNISGSSTSTLTIGGAAQAGSYKIGGVTVLQGSTNITLGSSGGTGTISLTTHTSTPFKIENDDSITISSNISSSGNFVANQITASGDVQLAGVVRDITLPNSYYLDLSGTSRANNITLAGTLNNGFNAVMGKITASGNISSSGVVQGLTGSFSKIEVNNPSANNHHQLDIEGNLGIDGDIHIESGHEINWQHGDASIVEGQGTAYSLGFNTFDGSSNTEVLLLEGDNGAKFSGHITASGNISSSGTGSFDYLMLGGATSLTEASTRLEVTGQINVGANGSSGIVRAHTGKFGRINNRTSGNNIIEFSSDNNVNILGPITASGNISASGRVYGTHFGTGDANRNALDLGTDNTMQFRINDGSRLTLTQTVFRPSTDEAVALGRTAQKWSELVVNHITASGNISASGTVVGHLVPQIPKVEYYAVTSSTLRAETVMELPNSLTYQTSANGYEYLEIFSDNMRLNRTIDYSEVNSSSVRFLVSIPSESVITYKSLREI